MRNILLMLSVMLLCASVFATNDVLPIGNGAAVSPWLICSIDDFHHFCNNSDYWDDYVRLECDLDLSAASVYTRAPIAPSRYINPYEDPAWHQGVPFTGFFDGNHHTISNLTILETYNAPGENVFECTALFGRIEGGTVINLHVDSADITGPDYAGLLCAWNSGGHIMNCSAAGTATARHTAGLCAVNEGNITSCHSTAEVTGTSNVGGLCGRNTEGIITNCSSVGSVRGSSSDVGGLVGDNQGGVVMNSFSDSEVSARRYAGGLCGSNSGYIENCYATGDVYAEDDFAGGLCGSNTGKIKNAYSIGPVVGADYNRGLCGNTNYFGTAVGCYWDTQTSGVMTSAGGQSKTTGQMQTLATFTDAGWDFEGETINGTEDIWWMPIDDYPAFTWAGCPFEMSADVNDDCKVNLIDLSIITDAWLQNCFANPHDCQ